MPHPIQAMESEGPRDGQLRRKLDDKRPRRDRSRDDGALEVPADVGSDQVGAAEDVEEAADGAAGDAV